MVSLNQAAPNEGADGPADDRFLVPPADAHVARSEGVSGILAALAGLPPAQQEVIRLKFQNGMSYKDISRITGHSVSHVGVLLHSGIKTLRKTVKGGAQ